MIAAKAAMGARLVFEYDHQDGAALAGDGHQHDHQHGAQGGQRDDRLRRIEVITGRERRRRWSAEEKAKITTESFAPGANISAVARRNGLSVGLLHYWRKCARDSVGGTPLQFVPVVTQSAAAASQADGGVIEIELAGTCIRLRGPVDQGNLTAVLAAVRARG
jgi:transposase